MAALLVLHPLTGSSAAIPRAAEERLIHDLVDVIAGESSRGSDFISESPADVASQDLVKIGEPTVPDLLQALESPIGWAKVHSIEVLAKIKDKRAIQPTLKIMRGDPEMGVRAVAAENLGSFGDTSAIPDLLDSARSPDTWLADGAWNSLGELRALSAIPVLIQHLNARVQTIPSGIMDPNQIPMNALVQIGRPAVPALIEALHTTTGTAQFAAATALGRVGSPEAIAALQKTYADPKSKKAATAGLLEGSSPELATMAANALGSEETFFYAQDYFERCTDPHCLKVLKATAPTLFTDRNSKENILSVEAEFMGRIKDPTSIPLLIANLRKGLAERESIKALDKFHTARAILSLLPYALKWETYESTDEEYAAEAIAHLGRPGAEALLRALKKDPATSHAVGHALGNFDDPKAGPEMVRVLKSKPDAAVRIGALDALGQMRYAPGRSAVFQALSDSNPRVRISAVCCLAFYRDSRAIAPLSEISWKQRWTVGKEWSALGELAIPALKDHMKASDLDALLAVSKVRTEEATELLIEGLRSKNALFAQGSADALGERRAAKATAALLEALNGQDINVRFSAYMALRRISPHY